VCVGVTTGDLLCTCVGARKMRSEYTVFGDAINLSARLMMKCRGGESPCCPFLSVLVAAVVLQLAVLQLVVLQLAV